MEDSVVNDLLDSSDAPNGKTLWSALKPIEEGSGSYREIKTFETNNGLRLLPGDIKLSKFEGCLYDLWTESLNRKIRGLKGSNALSELVNSCASSCKADYVFYDTGPNIGPLNRVILLDCDHFIIPAACDLFSVRALITLGQTLATWVNDWTSIRSFSPDGISMLPGRPHYLGYIPQKFRVYGDLKVGTFDEYARDIDKHVFSDVISILRAVDPLLADQKSTGTKLGEVRDFSQLVPSAQRSGTPIWLAKDGNPDLKNEAKSTFAGIATNIVRMTKSRKGGTLT